MERFNSIYEAIKYLLDLFRDGNINEESARPVIELMVGKKLTMVERAELQGLITEYYITNGFIASPYSTGEVYIHPHYGEGIIISYDFPLLRVKFMIGDKEEIREVYLSSV